MSATSAGVCFARAVIRSTIRAARAGLADPEPMYGSSDWMTRWLAVAM
jgi:hypothetical protein